MGGLQPEFAFHQIVCQPLHFIRESSLLIQSNDQLSADMTLLTDCYNFMQVLREVKALQQIELHPNIVKLKEVFPQGTGFVLVFEYMLSG